jgi:hypothetical protein
MLYDPKWEEKIVTKEEPWRNMLREAADLIEKRGWCQHQLEDHRGRVCALGALTRVPTRLVDAHAKAHLALENFINQKFSLSIVEWNDCRARTKEQVIETFLKAANS